MPGRNRMPTEKGAEYNIAQARAKLKRSMHNVRSAAGAVEYGLQGFDAVSQKSKSKLTEQVNEVSIEQLESDLKLLEDKLKSKEFNKLKDELTKVKTVRANALGAVDSIKTCTAEDEDPGVLAEDDRESEQKDEATGDSQ